MIRTLFLIFLIPCVAHGQEDERSKAIEDLLTRCAQEAELENKRDDETAARLSLRVDTSSMSRVTIATYSLNTKAFNELCTLSPDHLPFLISQLETASRPSESARWLYISAALGKITKSRPAASSLVSYDGLPLREHWATWWQDRYSTPSRFAVMYKKWKTAKDADEAVLSVTTKRFESATGSMENFTRVTSFGEATNDLRNLGLDAIPLIVEQFEAGDYSLNYLFEELTDRKDATPSNDSIKEKCAKHIRWWHDPSENAPAMHYQMPPLDAGKKK